MVLTDDLRKEIEDDIEKCKSHTEINGSEALYGELVAKYTTIDANFDKGLSTNGKATALGKEFDYRRELAAIAAKLKMLLLTNPSQNTSIVSENPLKLKIGEFISRGEEIKKSEYHPAEGGFPLSYVSGPKFNAWMGEINIFNTRHLKQHPLHQSINTTYSNYKKRPSSCEDMLGHLRALMTDEEFFTETLKSKAIVPVTVIKSIEELLSDDISRCQKYLDEDSDEKKARELYLSLTSRYDGIIKDFGSGLYSYYPDQHFYDPDVSLSTVIHNLKILLQKMISYQASNFASNLNKEGKLSVMSNKVFIVHGHDEAAKNTMARTLEKAGFEAIILHEQASSGMTIIEKIEAHTDVAYAVVLYTPCDLGRSKTETIENEKNRARQNVVFEHGYLIGRLGRKRVSAFVKGNLETPGDISGVVYTAMDDGGAWKIDLAKNMRAAGLSVDMNVFCS